ncbi:MAG TPA: ABC transporter permease subunit [Candidatus Sulfomarinibacteraceae bacterium]|nr:ABC transporter permease subunit [Candidatus Sulfomarinibacteraceae bacterium]
MNKVKTIIAKEWAEVFKNRLVLFSVAFLPLIFIALPIITLMAGGDMADVSMAGTAAEAPFPGTEALCEGLNVAECGEVYLLNIYAFMFMILPVAIPVTIAAYSIVGEKTMRSLEPLLATPITTMELLAGKALAAIVPAILATWLSFVIFLGVMRLLVSDAAFRFLLDPLWLLAIFVVGPMLTLLSASIAIMISARVTDPRVAEQISMLVILPIIAGLISQSLGLILIDREFVLIVALVVFVLDAILLFFTVQAFERETILTRWK